MAVTETRAALGVEVERSTVREAVPVSEIVSSQRRFWARVFEGAALGHSLHLDHVAGALGGDPGDSKGAAAMMEAGARDLPLEWSEFLAALDEALTYLDTIRASKGDEHLGRVLAALCDGHPPLRSRAAMVPQEAPAVAEPKAGTWLATKHVRFVSGTPTRTDMLVDLLEAANEDEYATLFAALDEGARFTALANWLGGIDEAEAATLLIRLVAAAPAVADRAPGELRELAAHYSAAGPGPEDSAGALEDAIAEARELAQLGSRSAG